MAKKDSLKTVQDLLQVYGDSKPVEFVSSGIDVLDSLWGGGVPLGYMAILWGVPGTGKSTLAAQVCRSFCRQGHKVAYLDSERALNSLQKDSFGLSGFESEGLFFHLKTADYRELEQQVKVLSESDVKLVVVDSVSQIEAWADKDVSLTDMQIGVKARQQGFVLPRMKSWFADAGISSILLFHARANFNTGGAWGAPTTKQDGGFVAQHVPDIITKLGIGGLVKEKQADGTEVPIGAHLYIECEKNKFGFTRRKFMEKLIYGVGISKRISLLDRALVSGVISRSGNTYSLPWGDKYIGIQKLYDMPTEQVRRLDNFIKSDGASEQMSVLPTGIVVDSDGVVVND